MVVCVEHFHQIQLAHAKIIRFTWFLALLFIRFQHKRESQT